jgi:polyferredoxin
VSPSLSPLHTVKALHTLIWAFFAACIVAIPLFAWAGTLEIALLFIGVVSIEVLVLVVNGWRCPLTAVAARYTEDRRDNFDIYLPAWLARHNKQIFGSLFVGGVLLTAVRWLGWLG